MQIIPLKIYFKFVSVLVLALYSQGALGKNPTPDDYYQKQIQPLFDARCISCHSCFNAPCQLNLQNDEGFKRGASSLNVYNGLRTESVFPTRLWVDAQATSDWRKKGFFEVPSKTLLSYLVLRTQHPEVQVKKQVAESMQCLKDNPENDASLGMPYGFPPLTSEEIQKVKTWVASGGGASSKHIEVPLNIKNQKRAWEKFLNGKSNSDRLVARYLYEHLFLAHLYFSQKEDLFFKLVRTSRPCSENSPELATRRPNDDPGLKKFYYCLTPFRGTIVEKTHIPYELGEAKLKRLKEIFYSTPWKANAPPSYARSVAENPFLAFQDIPAKARYEFLLEDAQYHVATFIKGPVCNGSNAVNSIQEQFYVFFLDKNADGMLLSKDYAKKISPLLMLPGVFGSDVDIKETPVLYKTLMDHREKYREARAEEVRARQPRGYSLNDIWNGDGVNTNAVLTVFRHDDNAAVVRGARGDLSKTVFMLDYPLFERLVYNLVVNFDVFGNVSHQLLTRIYMDMIRMEAEEMFLMFLPPEQRLALRKEWYRGFLTEVKMTYIFPTVGLDIPTGVRFDDEAKGSKKQMLEKILFQRLNEKVRGPLDAINWRGLEVPDSLKSSFVMDELERVLSELASVKAVAKTPFPQYFPDLSLVKVSGAQGEQRVFSIVHHREHENISWIIGETLRFSPEEDSLSVLEGYLGSYPNMIFDVSENDIKNFVERVLKMKSEEDYRKLVQQYGIPRTRADFWKHYDQMTSHQKKTQKVDFGYLDLTRYAL